LNMTKNWGGVAVRDERGGGGKAAAIGGEVRGGWVKPTLNLDLRRLGGGLAGRRTVAVALVATGVEVVLHACGTLRAGHELRRG